MRLKYNFIGLILACGLGLSSCNDSFLDRNPKDQLSDASFWKNAEDAQKFATGIYLYLIEPENHTIMTDCYTDNAIPVHVTAELPATHISYNYGKMPINASADAWYFTSI